MLTDLRRQFPDMPGDILRKTDLMFRGVRFTEELRQAVFSRAIVADLPGLLLHASRGPFRPGLRTGRTNPIKPGVGQAVPAACAAVGCRRGLLQTWR